MASGSPTGDHSPDPNTLNASASESASIRPATKNPDDRSVFRFAAFDNDRGDRDPLDPAGRKPVLAKVISLKGKSATDIEIPVLAGLRLSLKLIASPEVSATIFDDRNEIAGTNLARSLLAADVVRTISVKRSFAAGKWKLHLENTSQAETEVAEARPL